MGRLFDRNPAARRRVRRGSAAPAYLKAFVQEMDASGFVARSIERHGEQGLSPVK